jgi:hypothetical protein
MARHLLGMQLGAAWSEIWDDCILNNAIESALCCILALISAGTSHFLLDVGRVQATKLLKSGLRDEGCIRQRIGTKKSRWKGRGEVRFGAFVAADASRPPLPTAISEATDANARLIQTTSLSLLSLLQQH